jgi:polar amino acid transport system substrate-binding protein
MTPLRVAALLLCALLGASGCDLPRDADGSFARIRAGTLRAGVAEAPPWTRLAEGRPAGLEVELLEALAQHLAARIEWRAGGESALLQALERGELDVVIAGLERSTPWSSRVALTQPYARTGGEEHVMALRRGENRWLFELDVFLLSRRP